MIRIIALLILLAALCAAALNIVPFSQEAASEPTPKPELTAAPADTEPAAPTEVPTAAPTEAPEGYMTYGEKTRLVNFNHRLDDDFVPHDMVNAREFLDDVCDTKLDTTKIQYEVAVQFRKMVIAAKEEGVKGRYRLNNAYRTQKLQWRMWGERLAMNSHYGDDPYKNPVGTMPGNASEHCAGLALDVCSASYPSCDFGFGSTKECEWLYENAHRFGFIVRYPKDKTHITGVKWEPWHFRYVGVELAEEIHSRGICLEEYFGETP